MEDENWRDECVLNETGKIYTGNWEQIGHRPWNYAQVSSFHCYQILFVLPDTDGISTRLISILIEGAVFQRSTFTKFQDIPGSKGKSSCSLTF